MRRSVLAVLTTACFGLAWLGAAAGAAAQVVLSSEYKDFYNRSYVGYVAGLGPIPVVIHNDPFGADSDDAVVRQIPAPGFVSKASFRAAAGKEILAYDRLVIAFNAIPGTAMSDLCHEPTIPGTGKQDALYVLTTLCRGSHPTSQATLYIGGTMQSPDDPVFRKLMAEISYSAFPTQEYLPAAKCGAGC